MAAESERLLALVNELAGGIGAQARQQQDALAETRQLRHVIDGAAARLEAMIAGQRASRTEIQAIIEDLRNALRPGDDEG
jgi:hypothetical protein